MVKLEASQMSVFTDRKSNRTITKLTNRGINVHLYFTENSFSKDGKYIFYLSDMNNERCHFNIYRMCLTTGRIEQLTDEKVGIKCNSITKTPGDEYIAYTVGMNTIKLLDLKNNIIITLYDNPRFEIGQLNFSCDKKQLGFTRNEFINTAKAGGANYSGFYERYVNCKDGRVSTIDIRTGELRDVLRDTTWLAHFQYSPDDPKIAMFCHEGPWNYVTQRIWLLNMETGDFKPCFRQGPDDCVGHEFWTQDGNLIFDNRRKGHDGTISSNKTQVIAEAHDGGNEIPYFGIANKQGEVIKTFDMPYYCNHYHANADCSIFVGDAIEEILLIRPNKPKEEQLEVLVGHDTTWKYQWTHCHPCFSWQGDQILYAVGHDEDSADLYLARDIK